jgi:hypothetical protein
MILLNYAHPLSAEQLAALAAQLGAAPAVRTIAVQIDQGAALGPQVRALADAAGLDGGAWQTTALLVNLPGLAPAAAGLLAEIHGRAGYFPAVLRLRPRPGSTPTVYEVAEIVNLQELRERARAGRGGADQ